MSIIHTSFITLAAASALCLTCGCKSVSDSVVSPAPDSVGSANVPLLDGGKKGRHMVNVMNYAVVYRTSGDYDSNLIIGLTPDGKSVASYPAPSDISAESSEPIRLSGGWLLDRRGIPPYAAFTSYTYAEYQKLAAPPSPDVLLKSVLPEAKIVEAYRLPVLSSEAIADPSLCEKFISGDFKGCQKISDSNEKI